MLIKHTATETRFARKEFARSVKRLHKTAKSMSELPAANGLPNEVQIAIKRQMRALADQLDCVFKET